MNADPARAVRLVSVGGQLLRIHVRSGDPGRTPLLLVNGIGAGFESFDPLVDALDPDRPVIRFDPPGAGGSPVPTRPYRLPGLARTMLALLDVLGHDRVDVLGVSWGGGLAQQFAWTARHRCRRLVLVATGTGTLMVPARPRVLARMATPRRYTDPDFLRRVAPEIYGGTARHDPDTPARLLHTHSRAGSHRGYAFQLLAAAGWTSIPLPAAVAAADPGPHRRRRPAHPHGQRAPAHRAHPACPAARLSGRPPRTDRPTRTPHPADRGVPRRARSHAAHRPQGGHPVTENLQVGIGDALSTDYLLLRDQLTDTQLDYLARARRFVDEEVLPTINDYWDRAEFPVAAGRKARRDRAGG